ncbi:hypothetical protein HYX12_00225 [Candidatus Woesearchaeota archaeon]|nr:hypothetical protein [Candidatus Woesearchaeota archaeon]
MEEVKEVLKAEKEAEQIISQAQKDAEKLISKSKQAALEKINLEKKNLDMDFDLRLKKRIQELEKERQDILDHANNAVSRIEKQAEKNSEKAVNLILAEVIYSGEQ